MLHALARQLELTHRPDERDHDLGVRVAAGLEALDGGLGDGAHLELDEARHGQQQADPAQAEHRVGLVALAHHGQELLVGRVQLTALAVHGHLDAQLGQVRQELVQRRVDEAHRHGLAVHRLEHLDEVALLQRQEGGQGGLALGVGGGQDEVLDELLALAQEHVLGAAQAHTLGAAVDGVAGVVGGVGVGAHLQAADRIGVAHEAVHGGDELTGVVVSGRLERLVQAATQVGHDRGVDDADLTEEDLAGGAVDGDDVLTGEDLLASRDAQGLGSGVDLKGLGATHAGLAHAAGDDGGMAGLAAAGREHAGGRDHAGQVVGVGLAAHEDDGVALLGAGDGLVVVEGDVAHGGARGGGHGAGEQVAAGVVVELGEHQLGELLTGDACEGLVHGDELFVDELGGHAEGGRGGALAHAGLEHPQLAALDGELDVAQVAVVGLQAAHDGAQLVVGGLVQALEVGQGQGVADAGDDVLALGVDQVVAVDAGAPGGGVAGEAHAGAGGLPHVAEHHGAHVDRGAQVVRDLLAAAVDVGALGVPGAEDGLGGHVQLGAGVLREVDARVLLDDGLVLLHQLLEGVHGELVVHGDAPRILLGLQGVGEVVAVDVQDGLTEHLDEAAVGVPGEALVGAGGGQALDGDVVEADVEDGLHHAGHGELGAASHRDEQGVLGGAELAPQLLLDSTQSGSDLDRELLRDLAAGQVGATGVGGDGEAGGNGEIQPGHLRQIRSLASQEILLVLVTLAEAVHVLGHPCLFRFLWN